MQGRVVEPNQCCLENRQWSSRSLVGSNPTPAARRKTCRRRVTACYGAASHSLDGLFPLGRLPSVRILAVAISSKRASKRLRVLRRPCVLTAITRAPRR